MYLANNASALLWNQIRLIHISHVAKCTSSIDGYSIHKLSIILQILL